MSVSEFELVGSREKRYGLGEWRLIVQHTVNVDIGPRQRVDPDPSSLGPDLEVLDADDKCPVDAEDNDGFEDEDGCPDLDNDGDGVADKVDKCSNEAEDVDGFQDSDGCPDNDNDGDGLPDLGDLCPNHAEDMDNVADDDGCPEDNDNDGIADADD